MIRNALSGGRAPRAWQRGIARAVAPLWALRRSAAWLAGLARVRLGLRDEPLLGRCFHEIASQPFPSSEPVQPEARSKPTRPRFDEPVFRPGRTAEPGVSRERRQPAPMPMPRREEPRRRERNEETGLPMGLDPHVSREMLERLAFAPPGTVETPQSVARNFTGSRNFGASPSPSPRTFGAPSPQTSGASPSPSPRTFPPGHEPVAPSARRGADRHPGGWRRPGVSGPGKVSDDGLGRLYGRSLPAGAVGKAFTRVHRETLERLAGHRVGGALSGASAPGREGEGSSLAAPSGKDPSPTLPRFAGEGAASLSRETQDLPAPWRLSVTGETAPGQLLERWRTPGLDAPARGPRQSSPPGAAPRNLPSLPRDESAPVPIRQSEATEPAHQETTLLPPPPSLPPFLRTNGAGDGLARHPVTAAVEAKTILAPPAGPAVPPAEDLDALAAKIQRILDDEARRHGISV